MLRRVAELSRVGGEAVGVDVLDAAVGDEVHAADAGAQQVATERDHGIRPLGGGGQAREAVVRGDDQHRMAPAPERPQLVDEAADRRVGAGDRPETFLAVGPAAMSRAVDVRQGDHGQVGLLVGGLGEQRADRRGIEAVAGGGIAPGGRGLLGRPEDIGRSLASRDRGEQVGELRLAEHAGRHQLRRSDLGHREERLDLDELRVLDLLGGRIRHSPPVRVAGDAMHGRVDARQEGNVVRVGPRRHHRVRCREDRRPLRLARDEIEQSRHARRGGESRVEPVDDDEVHVRLLGARGPRNEEQRQHEQEPSHPPRVDRRGVKS